jgi:predicted nucleic acid-binding protein
MRVVDSSLWVEYFADSGLADYAETCIKPLETCVVPTMVYYELAKWCSRNFDTDRANETLSLLNNCHIVDMNVAIADEAARVSLKHKLHATDAIIYATARLMEVDLCTCDAHFEGLPGVTYSAKSSS